MRGHSLLLTGCLSFIPNRTVDSFRFPTSSVSCAARCSKLSSPFPHLNYHSMHEAGIYNRGISHGMTHSPLNHDGKPDDKKDNVCPFSMTFQRYRIPLTRGKDTPKGSVRSNRKLGFLSDFKTSLDRSTLERKYPTAVKEGLFVWFDAASNLSPVPERKNEKNEQVVKGRVGVHVSNIYWRTLADVADSVRDRTDGPRTVVLGLPNSSLIGLKQLVDISNWLEEMSVGDVFSVAPEATVHAVVDEDAPVPTVILTATAQNQDVNDGVPITQRSVLTLDIVERRMKSWVNRILVRMEICPFTKSNSKSGQGLGDVGVPVANIAYHYSSAYTSQIYRLMAGKWIVQSLDNTGRRSVQGSSFLLLII